MSRPIVVTPCMLPSFESWSPQRRPPQWHLRAGGGAVHSIITGPAGFGCPCVQSASQHDDRPEKGTPQRASCVPWSSHGPLGTFQGEYLYLLGDILQLALSH